MILLYKVKIYLNKVKLLEFIFSYDFSRVIFLDIRLGSQLVQQDFKKGVKYLKQRSGQIL